MEGFLEEVAFVLSDETRPREGRCTPDQGTKSAAVQGLGDKGPAQKKARVA